MYDNFLPKTISKAAHTKIIWELFGMNVKKILVKSNTKPGTEDYSFQLLF